MESNALVQVGIVEDQRRTREGLRALIDGAGGFICVGAWRSIEETLAAPRGTRTPQVVLLDLGLPGMSGIAGIPRLREKWPSAVLVILTVYEDNDRVFEALCAGATGYLLKNTAPSKLLEGLSSCAPSHRARFDRTVSATAFAPVASATAGYYGLPPLDSAHTSHGESSPPTDTEQIEKRKQYDRDRLHHRQETEANNNGGGAPAQHHHTPASSKRSAGALLCRPRSLAKSWICSGASGRLRSPLAI